MEKVDKAFADDIGMYLNLCMSLLPLFVDNLPAAMIMPAAMITGGTLDPKYYEPLSTRINREAHAWGSRHGWDRSKTFLRTTYVKNQQTGEITFDVTRSIQVDYIIHLRVKYSEKRINPSQRLTSQRLTNPRVNLSIASLVIASGISYGEVGYHLFGYPNFRSLKYDLLPTLFEEPVSINLKLSKSGGTKGVGFTVDHQFIDSVSDGDVVKQMALPGMVLAVIAKKSISFRVLPGDTENYVEAMILKAIAARMRDDGLRVDMRDRKTRAVAELKKRAIGKKDLADLASLWTTHSYQKVYEARRKGYVVSKNAGWGHRPVKAEEFRRDENKKIPSLAIGETVNETMARIMRTSALRAPQTPPGLERPKYLYRGMHNIDSSLKTLGYLDWSSYIATTYDEATASHFAFSHRTPPPTSPSPQSDRGVIFRINIDNVPAGTPWVWFAGPMLIPEKLWEKNDFDFRSASLPKPYRQYVISNALEDEVLLPPGRIVLIPRGADVAEAKKTARRLYILLTRGTGQPAGVGQKRTREQQTWRLQLGNDKTRVDIYRVKLDEDSKSNDKKAKYAPWLGLEAEAVNLLRVLSTVPKTAKISDFWGGVVNDYQEDDDDWDEWAETFWLTLMISGIANREMSLFTDAPYMDAEYTSKHSRWSPTKKVYTVNAMYVPDIRATSVSNPSAPIVRSLHPKLNSNNA